MLSLKTIENLESFLLSDGVSAKGSQFPFVFGLLAELAAEKQRLQTASRVTPAMPPMSNVPVLSAVPSPPEAA